MKFLLADINGKDFQIWCFKGLIFNSICKDHMISLMNYSMMLMRTNRIVFIFYTIQITSKFYWIHWRWICHTDEEVSKWIMII